MNEEKFLYQSDTPSKTIYDRAMKYLDEKYNIRFNTIALELEIQLKENMGNWFVLNINSLLIELAQSGIDINMNKLEILVRSHLIQQYNPIREYFENLETWDGENYIKNLCQYLKTNDDEAFYYHFEKWLTRAVLCSLTKGYVNKQSLVLASHQNSGKSSFLRFLIPPKLENYYTENISIDKDGIISICKNLICNLDELAVLSKSDVNTLKSFISKSSANIRLPYARKAEFLERICSFVGSTNRTDFLTDETGSIRWLIFEVYSFDFEYSKEVDMDKVWSQAYYNAFERKNYNPELTAEDLIENEKRNEKFKQITLEQEILITHFEKSENKNDFLTATEIMLAMSNALGVRMNNVKIGKALTALNFERIKHSKKQIYGYLSKRKIEDEKNE